MTFRQGSSAGAQQQSQPHLRDEGQDLLADGLVKGQNPLLETNGAELPKTMCLPSWTAGESLMFNTSDSCCDHLIHSFVRQSLTSGSQCFLLGQLETHTLYFCPADHLCRCY